MVTTEKIERVATGIPGLDKLLGGGIPKGSTVEVLGEPGTGKTIFGIQFLEAGLKNGETCVYLTIDERVDRINMQANMLGCFKGSKGKLKVYSAKDIKYDIGLGKKPQSREEQIKLAVEKIMSSKPDRVVVDPINSLNARDGESERALTQFLVDKLNTLGSTNILIGESIDGTYSDRTTPFIVDGVLQLYYITFGPQTGRSMVIKKMRLTAHSEDVHPIRIDCKKGFQVLSA